MQIFEIILIGIGLSMDAFAVCLSAGMIYPSLTRRQKRSMPVAFGLFQGLMPVLGYYLGSLFADIVSKCSGYIALIILGVIGINMIREGLSHEKQEARQFTVVVLLLQAIATSIDAFAVGVSFAVSKTPIFAAAPIIAATTFVCSMIALAVGEKVGKRLGDRAEIAGGIILILIGIKALF